MTQTSPCRLADVDPELALSLTNGVEVPVTFASSQIIRYTVDVVMRDGIRLATDIYRPATSQAPSIAVRTPYGRAQHAQHLIALAQHGYVVISQDCRGTGDSEPDVWDYFIYEPEDSFDFVEWITRQDWFDGFVGGCGGSYLAATQWCMAAHPLMGTIVPEVGGIGVAFNTVRYYMFLNAYSRSVGKGEDKVPVHYSELERQMLDETLAGGYFNEPLEKPLSEKLLQRYSHLRKLSVPAGKRWLWKYYGMLPPGRRAELIKLVLGVSDFTFVEMESLCTDFGFRIAYGAHSIPASSPSRLSESVQAPALMITGWYDWGLNEALATWDLISRESCARARADSRLLITPNAHNVPGYHEGEDTHPELRREFRTQNIVDLLLRWYAAVREGKTGSWPEVTYYLMGANEWHVASTWPPPQAKSVPLYLGSKGTLALHSPPPNSAPDSYIYSPSDPTPTVGGNIVSYVYPAGSVDVSKLKSRSDILTYTTSPLARSVDLVGPLRIILYVSSSAADTDFAARLSDVFPDGRAIQLQTGILRTRYRHGSEVPEFLEPGRVYRLEIDMWATANRFETGHRVQIDISSADFPRFDRHSNRTGDAGPPVPALQTIFHDAAHPSHLLAFAIGDFSTREPSGRG